MLANQHIHTHTGMCIWRCATQVCIMQTSMRHILQYAELITRDNR